MSLRIPLWNWIAAAVLAAPFMAACGGSDKTADDPPPQACTPQSCQLTGTYCDTGSGECVECLAPEHCGDGQTCEGHACVPATPCSEENPCPNDGVCGEGGTCLTSREVHCAPPTDGQLPDHATSVDAMVAVTWNATTGWSSTPACDWECDDGYEKDVGGAECVKSGSQDACEDSDDCTGKGCVDGVCSSSKKVPCQEEGSGKPTGQAVAQNPTVTVRWDASAGDWKSPELCQWKCAEGTLLDEGENLCRGAICGDGKVELDEKCDTGADAGGVPVYPAGKDTCTGAMNKSGRTYVGEISCADGCAAIDTSDCREVTCTYGKSCRNQPDGTTLVCKADGTGYEEGDCGEGFVCNDYGLCEVHCTPGACRYADDGTLEVCGRKGTLWQTKGCENFSAGTSCVIPDGAKEGFCTCASNTCNSDGQLCDGGAWSSCPTKGDKCRMTENGETAACVPDTYCEAADDCAGRRDGLTRCDVGSRTCVACLEDDHCRDGEKCQLDATEESAAHTCVSLCGNGTLDTYRREICDGGFLDGQTCASQGFASGDLGCTSSCAFDYSKCVRHADQNIVMSQVYGFGGESGAAFASDYVELFNHTDNDLNLYGWSIQYASKTGSSWGVNALSGIVPAHGYFLVKAGSSGSAGDALAGDGSISQNLAGASGKVLLSRSTARVATAACPTDAHVADFLAYGAATSCDATAATGVASVSGDKGKALFRKVLGCQDTDANGADWEEAAAAPRSAASAAYVCGSGACPQAGCIGNNWCESTESAMVDCGGMACAEGKGCVQCARESDCGEGEYCTDGNACAPKACATPCVTMDDGEGGTVHGACSDFGEGLPGTVTACGGDTPFCVADAGAGSCVQCVHDGDCEGGAVCAGNVCGAEPRAFISEYVEGSSNNKALEIYNDGDAALSCVVKIYANGSTASKSSAGFSVPAKGTFTLCNPSADSALATRCSALGSSAMTDGTATAFSGDDALELACGGRTMDIFGRIGEQATWSASIGGVAASTKDRTLRRNCSVSRGVTANPEEGFPTLATQWIALDKDTFDGLGAHVAGCESVSCGSGADCVSGVCGEGGKCAAEKTVSCTAAENVPENATANPVTQSVIHFADGEWEPVPQCGWTCAAGLHPEGDACVGTERTVPCEGAIPEHAVLDNATIDQVWNGEAWIPSDIACAWTGCEDGYHVEEGACASDARTVPCADVLPAHAVPSVESISMRWEGGAWTSSEECAWSTCETGWYRDGDACAAYCGNGVLDEGQGEECDPADPSFDTSCPKWNVGTRSCSDACKVVSDCVAPVVSCRSTPEAFTLGIGDELSSAVHLSITAGGRSWSADQVGHEGDIVSDVRLFYRTAAVPGEDGAEDVPAGQWLVAGEVGDSAYAAPAAAGDGVVVAYHLVKGVTPLEDGVYEAVWGLKMENAAGEREFVYCPMSEDGPASPVAADGLEDAAKTTLAVDSLWCDGDHDCDAGQGLVCHRGRCLPPPAAFISEYVHGSAQNRAVEVYNASGYPLTCTLTEYANGKDFANGTTKQAITVQPGGTGAWCHGQAGSALKAYCDAAGAVYDSTGAMSFNGNDALVLVCDDVVVDYFGRVGEDPGSAGWKSEGGEIVTASRTLRRKCGVAHGVTANPSAGFPALGSQWTSFPKDTYDGVGAYEQDCAKVRCVRDDDCPGGLCGEGGTCAVEKESACEPVAEEDLPQNAQANPAVLVTVTYQDGAWTSPGSCGFSCRENYDLTEAGECAARTRQVTCDDSAPLAVANAHYVGAGVPVLQTWTGEGWDPEVGACAWECDGHHRLAAAGDACEPESREVACAGSIPLNATAKNATVTVTWNPEAGDWNAPAACEWTCDDPYVKNAAENACTLCGNGRLDEDEDCDVVGGAIAFRHSCGTWNTDNRSCTGSCSFEGGCAHPAQWCQIVGGADQSGLRASLADDVADGSNQSYVQIYIAGHTGPDYVEGTILTRFHEVGTGLEVEGVLNKPVGNNTEMTVTLDAQTLKDGGFSPGLYEYVWSYSYDGGEVWHHCGLDSSGDAENGVPVYVVPSHGTLQVTECAAQATCGTGDHEGSMCDSGAWKACPNGCVPASGSGASSDTCNVSCTDKSVTDRDFFSGDPDEAGLAKADADEYCSVFVGEGTLCDIHSGQCVAP